METRDYLIEDIKGLPANDISKLYKYVRTHLIANIDGLKDPLEHSHNSASMQLPKSCKKCRIKKVCTADYETEQCWKNTVTVARCVTVV